MATVRNRGDMQVVTQITHVTIAGTWATGDTATLTINGKDLVVTVGSDAATTDVAEAIAAAVNGSELVGDESRNTTGDLIPEFAKIVATVSGSIVVLTGTDEEPFTLTASEVTVGNGTATASDERSAEGPSHWLAENFRDTAGASNAVPLSGDTLIFDASSQSYLYDLTQSSQELAAFDVNAGFSGAIGLPRQNAAGYDEYRLRALQIGIANAGYLRIGRGAGPGSGRLIFDLGSSACNVEVIATSSPADAERSAVQLIGSALTSLLCSGGSVDVAPEFGATSSVTTITVNGSGFVRCSAGVTHTTIALAGNGAAEIMAAATTITLQDGASLVKGNGNVTTLNHYGDSVTFVNTAALTVGTLNLGLNAVLDLTNAGAAVTFTNSNFAAGVQVIDPNGRAVWTNPTQLQGCGLNDIQFATKKGITVKVA